MRPLAVVTGASSGIGAATARRLAADGFEIVAAARRVEACEALVEEVGGRAVRLDVTDPQSVTDLAGHLERLDVLVNNAGGAVGLEPVSDSDPADWQQMYDVNVLGTLRMTQAVLPLLRDGHGGTIVNVTSMAAFVTYEGGGGYTAAKHAEHALSETLRLELAGEPVRVIEVAPGMVQTEDFSLTRLRGDAKAAEEVYTDVDRPLTAADVAGCIGWAVALPHHVNVDCLVVRPLAQAAVHKLHRGPLFR